MAYLALDHVQIAMPPGAEEEARGFYRGVLGPDEVPKPPGVRRFYVHDPFGNRIEILQPD